MNDPLEDIDPVANPNLSVDPVEWTPKFPPNEDQEQAINDFFEFMLNPNETEFHLTGGAGMGKTFTLDLIMNEGMNRYEQGCKLMGIEQTIFNMALTATTNKAADVLSLSTGRQAVTIHSFMKFKVFEDYKTGEKKINVSRDTIVRQHELIIIDEASMIDNTLYALLHKYTHKCKFLYVGDHCQMAPVKEKLSKIYDNKRFFSNLTKPMRNAGQPALMALCQQLRETVETGVFKPIEEVPGVIDYLDGPQMEAEIGNVFSDLNPSSRILCYRNVQVQDYNAHIRGIRGLPAYFEEGEVLVSNSAVTIDNFNLSVESEVEIIDNPHKEITKTINGYDLNFYEVELRKVKIKGLYSGASTILYLPSDMERFMEVKKYFARMKEWTYFFHLDKNYPDLRPKDSSTVYKAQGSTYETVYVDLGDISKCTHADQVARMLYVACSRPTTRLALYGQLKPAYCGG